MSPKNSLKLVMIGSIKFLSYLTQLFKNKKLLKMTNYNFKSKFKKIKMVRIMRVNKMMGDYYNSLMKQFFLLSTVK